MTKVTLRGYIVVPDDDIALVTEVLPEHIEKTRNESGCLIFQVDPDLEDKNRFNVYEEFVSREAFESHQKRVKASRWGQITSNVKRFYEINEST